MADRDVSKTTEGNEKKKKDERGLWSDREESYHHEGEGGHSGRMVGNGTGFMGYEDVVELNKNGSGCFTTEEQDDRRGQCTQDKGTPVKARDSLFKKLPTELNQASRFVPTLENDASQEQCGEERGREGRPSEGTFAALDIQIAQRGEGDSTLDGHRTLNTAAQEQDVAAPSSRETMRIPLTPEQRRRRPRPYDSNLPQREHLVVATPVDIQAYRQRQRRRQLEMQQNIPHAIPEEEFRAQMLQQRLQQRREQWRKNLYWAVGTFAVGLILLSITTMVTYVLRGGKSNDSSTVPLECFKTTQQLRDVTDRFMELRLQNWSLVHTEIELVYGRIEDWCVGDIQDFSELFSTLRNVRMLTFSRDISRWNTSSATNMSYMFYGAIMRSSPEEHVIQAKFNQNISSWDVSNVVDMSHMFDGADAFDHDISSWNVSNVRTMRSMFQQAVSFNQPIGRWAVSRVTDMNSLFAYAYAFNQPLENWDVSHVHDTSMMFLVTPSFNRPLASWNVSSVNEMYWMFSSSSFNQNINGWDVSSVKYMHDMFAFSLFNQPLADWDVSNVIDMSYAFEGEYKFNQALGTWNVSSVKSMAAMFQKSKAFNQPLDSWALSSVTNLDKMFYRAEAFNQSLCSWGEQLPKNAWVHTMFKLAGSCPITLKPDLGADPPGPFCYPCGEG